MNTAAFLRLHLRSSLLAIDQIWPRESLHELHSPTATQQATFSPQLCSSLFAVTGVAVCIRTHRQALVGFIRAVVC
jgi:hypothetical protein